MKKKIIVYGCGEIFRKQKMFLKQSMIVLDILISALKR